jgi:hypothetical protein
MSGPHDSVIGMQKEGIVQRFLDALPGRFGVGEKDVRLNAVILEIDPHTGKSYGIERKVARET